MLFYVPTPARLGVPNSFAWLMLLGMLMAAMPLESGARRWMRLAGCSALIGSSLACMVATADAPIIEEYKQASCVPLSAVRRVQPSTREWDSRLSFDGQQVVVKGAQIPGGRIVVSDSTSTREAIAADPGDYIYPIEVRSTRGLGALYTKAHGLAAGLTEETWLFKYDLRRREIIERTQIRRGILPDECEATDDSVKPRISQAPA